MAPVVFLPEPIEDSTDTLVYAPQVEGDPDLRLNHAGTVEGIVADFLERVLDVRGDALSGHISSDDAIQSVVIAARTASFQLLGEDHAYQGDAWNTPGGLGQTLVNRFGLACDPEDAPYVLLLNLAAQSLASLADGAAGLMPDYLVAYRLEGGIANVRDAFLGMDAEKSMALLARRDEEAKEAVSRGLLTDRAESGQAVTLGA